MPTVAVFDCESDSKPDRCGPRGEQDFRFVQCTVACALVLDTDCLFSVLSNGLALDSAKRITCWRDVAPTKGASPFKELLDAFDRADLIVGYNSLDFDLPLLHKHYGSKGSRRYLEHRLKSLDVFSRIRAVTNQWPKLEELLTANQLGGKSGDGAQAIKLWEEGRRDELQQYCMQDVLRTAELALLPKLRFGNAWIPNHVYGIGPAYKALRFSDEDNKQSPSPPPPCERPVSDDEFVLVKHPGELADL